MKRVTRHITTTTLLVTKPTNFEALEARYNLVRYVLPGKLFFRRNSNDYGQMHNCLRDQIAYPYKTYKHDHLDGRQKWVVYVLYPKDIAPAEVKIEFLDDYPLSSSPISFADIEFHILLKLLQIAYFRDVKKTHFIGQDNCYLYDKKEKDERHTCLQVELRGDISNNTTDLIQAFKVIGHATPFRRVPESSRPYNSRAYFGAHVVDNMMFFTHLRSDELPDTVHPDRPIYEIRARKGHRTTLSYHDLRHLDASVGKILYDFIKGFRAFLAEHAIHSRLRERELEEFQSPKVSDVSLNIMQLQPIYVYDNRIQRDHPLEAYLQLFRNFFPSLTFTPLENEELRGPALIVQDCDRDDFEEGEILADLPDPYPPLYKRYSHVAKQTINVNSNDQKKCNREEYLSYPLPNSDSTGDFHRKFEVALNQLYLKDMIIHNRTIEPLPFHDCGFAFIRKATNASASYETLLYVEDTHLQFVDLRTPAGKDIRDTLASRFGIDWDSMYERMLQKYRRIKDDEVEDLTSYDVILGPGQFIELEDLNERVLYNYDKIIARQAAYTKRLPIDDLKLVPHFDRIKGKGSSEAESAVLLRQLSAYDDYLESLRSRNPEISFEELTRTKEHMLTIARIFQISPNEKGKYSRKKLMQYYQFASPRSGDVQLYQGIWFDPTDQSYLVGDVNPPKEDQDRAQLIRRFDVYVGSEQFSIESLLAATSVRFVRHKQFTVYPYFFHLIDLYVESVLHFQ